MVRSLILLGDARARLAEIEAGSVQTCVTSPPYYGLRDYGTASWDGGDPDCQHTLSQPDADRKAAFDERVTRGDRSACLGCGASRIDLQIGLEQTPEQYIEEIVGLFREVRRVLAEDGTLWLNLGDSYSSGYGPGLPAKNLLGIPWRVALALQAEGWILRSEIIWAKPNPLPESVKDRPTKSHEHLFLLAQSPNYFYDHEAIKEPVEVGDRGSEFHTGKTGEHQLGRSSTRPRRPSAPQGSFSGKGAEPVGGQRAFRAVVEQRNKRDVWRISTKPFNQAHFAVMPEALAEPCVLAGSRPGDRVLDPFAGSGTVGVVANRHDRDFIGVELNPDYAIIARDRIWDSNPLFSSVLLVPEGARLEALE